MRAFQNLPIKWKLMLAMLLTGMIAVLLLGSALFFAGLIHLRNLEVQETAALAEIVGGNCAAALEHRDAKAAQKELGDIAANPTIEDACLYTADGQLLARYTRGDLTPQPLPQVSKSGENFAGDRLTLYRPVKHDGHVVGTIYLRTDSRIVWARLKSYVGMGILVMGISMLVALIFANRLQRFFSAPILELVRVAQGVAERKDFTLRAARLSNDETGLLTDTFNKMLGLIQEHDSGSRSSQSRLEKRVAERTVELRRVNETLRRSEDRLRLALEASNAGAWSWDVASNVSTWDERYHEMHGFGAGDPVSFEAWMARVHPEDRQRLLARIHALLKPGEDDVWNEEFRICHPGKGERWMAGVGRVQHDATGQAVRFAGLNLDITARKQAEESLRRSEANLQIALDAAKLGPWHWDIVRGELFWSPQCLALYGMPAGTAITREQFLQAVHPDDRERVQAALHDAVEKHAEYVVEKRVLRPDGSVRWTASRGRCHYDDTGRAIRMDGVSFDITQHKEAEEALLESEDRYRSLFATSLDAVLLGTVDGRILAANTAACRMFGLTEEELISVGRNGVADVSDPRLKAASEERDRTGSFYGELTFLRSDGTKFPAEVSSVIFRADKGESRVSVVIRDITERKRAQDALRENEARLRSFLDNSAVIGWLKDEEGRHVFLSENYERRFGVCLEDWKGKTDFDVWPREIAEEFRRNDQAVLAGDKPVEVVEFTTDKDGKKTFWLNRKFCFRDAAGKRFVGGLGVDITERKQAEEALKKSQGLLAESQRIGNVGGWEFDIDTQKQTWTEEVYRIHEVDLTYQPTVEEGINFYTPASRPIIERAVQRAIEHGEPFDVELEIITAKGNLRQVHAIGKEDLEHRRVFGFFQDISERKRIEETLARTAREWQATFDASNDAIWLLDKEQRVVRSNKMAEQIFKHPDGRPFGQHCYEIVHGTTEPIPECPVERARKSLRREIMELLIGERWYQITADPILDTAGQYDGAVHTASDITERKRTEEALRRLNETLEQRVAERTAASEQRTQALKEAQRVAHIGSWTLEVETGSITWSEELYRIFGRDPNLPAPHISEYPQILTAESLARRQAAAEQTLRTGEPYNIDLEIVRPDGKRRWILSHGEAVRNAAGRVVKLRGTAQDITERKRAAETLRESEEKHRILFESSRDAIMTLAPPTWRFTSGNPATVKIFGAKNEEKFISLGPWELSPERQPDGRNSAEKAREMIETAMREGSHCFEWTHRRINGEVFPATVLLSRMQSAGKVFLQATVRDITERKRVEALVRESEERLRFALESRHTGAWDINLVDHTAFRSIEHDRIFGYKELLPRWTYEMFLGHVLPEDRAEVDAKFQHAVQTRSDWDFECRIRRTDGEVRWIWATGHHWQDADGTPRRMAGIVQDITERKQAEDALRQSEDKFQRIVGHIRDVLYSVDMETREFRYISPAFEKMFGYTGEDIRNMGGRAAFLKRVIENRKMSVTEETRRLERLKSEPNGGSAIRDEEWWRCKYGTLRCIEDRWIPVYQSGRLATIEG
ncbi:MAG: PAS domain S-box protein, partial [Verrucomicrobia bacterium]|nr:PAS domain S-box protein [Verrucomicrobiota bacterium]